MYSNAFTTALLRCCVTDGMSIEFNYPAIQLSKLTFIASNGLYLTLVTVNLYQDKTMLSTSIIPLSLHFDRFDKLIYRLSATRRDIPLLRGIFNSIPTAF